MSEVHSMPPTKRCWNCKQEKPAADFHRAKKADGTWGLQGQCKLCANVCRRGRVAKRRIVVTELRCNYCGLVKPADAFNKKRKTMTGREPHCKECRNAAYKRRRAENLEEHRRRGREDWKRPARWDRYYQRSYGITLAQYEAMLGEQDGTCYVCRLADKKKLGVDHDHTTGAIRRLLCDRCNRVLAQAKDDPGLLEKLALYLRAHGKEG